MPDGERTTTFTKLMGTAAASFKCTDAAVAGPTPDDRKFESDGSVLQTRRSGKLAPRRRRTGSLNTGQLGMSRQRSLSATTFATQLKGPELDARCCIPKRTNPGVALPNRRP